MGQEVSISLQAAKSKIYKLIDAMVEGRKTEAEVQESMQRWWRLIHPADRPVAQRYVLWVLEKSQASLGAVADGLLAFKDFEPIPEPSPEKSPKLHPVNNQPQVPSAI
jgi:hypothetical protein